MSGRLFKGTLVVLGAITLSTLGIFASDGLQGMSHDLGALTGSAGGPCPAGMVFVAQGENELCVDTYEASPSADCPHSGPRSIIESEANANADNCYAAVGEDATPWRYVSLPQAQRLCASSGKRLPTSDEWYRLALGTDVARCVTDESSVTNTGTSECRSAVGAYDMVGNVWEWVDETVVGRTFDGRELPEEGYVSSVDASGVPITTGETADTLYGEDYFWSKDEGVFGMIRGGFYGSETDAGLYTINAAVPTSFASQGVGFRCVKDIK